MKATGVRVSAVVVSYNVADLLRNCLRSLDRARRAGELDEIIVVDSSSSDDSVTVARETIPDARVVVVPNRGFGAGVNRGIEVATGDAILTLNPDTEVHPGAIRMLTDQLFARCDVGLVGPRLLYPDGSEQPTRRRFPTPWTPIFESTVVEEWLSNNRWARDYRMVDAAPPTKGAEPVDWLVGAALMVRRQAVESAGGYDESFFLYGEELEWCYRLRRHGWDIRYVPNSTVTHHEAASTSQDRLGSRLEFDRGRVRAQRAIHGDRVARRTACLLKLNFAIQLLREGLKWSLGHRRDLRRQRIDHYWTLMRSKLDE